MRKLRNFKKKFVAVLMSVMCLTMIVPSGISVLAAVPADDDNVYTVTLADCDDGIVTFDDAAGDTAEFAEGDEVALSVTPDEGYAFSGITLTLTETGEVAAEDYDVEDTVGYTFTMPAADVTVTASFEAKAGNDAATEAKEDIETEVNTDPQEAELPSGGVATLSATAANGIMPLATAQSTQGVSVFPSGTTLPEGQAMQLKKANMSIEDHTGGKISVYHQTKYFDRDCDMIQYAVPREATTYTNPCTIYFTDAGSVEGRTLDVKLDITELKVHDLQTIPDGETNNIPNSDFKDIVTFTTTNVDDVGFGISSDPFSLVDVSYILTIYYDDDASETPVTFPCWQRVSDIDVVYPEKNDFREAWECDTTTLHQLFVWNECVLDTSTNGDNIKFTANPDHTNLNGDDSLYMAGVIAASDNGQWEGKCYDAYCETDIDPYVSLENNVTKKVTSSGRVGADGEYYLTGDTVSYSVTYDMNTFYKDTFSYYSYFEFSDTIPEGLSYVDGSAHMYFNDTDISNDSLSDVLTYSDGTIKCVFTSDWLDDIADYSGEALTLKFDCTVDEVLEDHTITNTGLVTLNEDVLRDSADILVLTPKLAINKTGDATSYSLGDTVTYTITVDQTVAGAVAKNTVVTDTLPDELELISAESDMGTVEINGNSLTVNVGDLTDRVTITVQALAIAEGDSIENHAYATADNIPTVEDEWDASVRQPELDIEKTSDGDTFYPGDTITYHIKVKNNKTDADDDKNGDTEAVNEDATETTEESNTETYATEEDKVPTAYDVVVSDTLPDELTLIDVVDENGGDVVIDGNSFTVTYPEMYYGQEFEITMTAKVNDDVGNTEIKNVATVSSSNTDPVSDYDEVEVIKPILAIEKEADADYYAIGDDVTYTILVTQTEAGLTAENVVVTDTLPDEIELLGAMIDGSVPGDVTMEGNTLTVDIPELAYGETATITVNAIAVAAGTDIDNTATATADHADEVSDDAIVNIPQPSLAIRKTADKDTYNTGETVTFTITVSEETENTSESNVVMTDTLPDGLTLSGTPSIEGVEGTITTNGNTVEADIPVLTYGQNAVITVQATVDAGHAGTTITNTAYAHGDNTDEVNDDASLTVNEEPVAETPNTPTKTGQNMAPIIAVIVGCAAVAAIFITVRRRRRIW